jgi:protein-serine/threonine kinase
MNDPKRLRKSGKPTRVEDINSVMETQNYMVIKGNKNPGDDPDMDDSMNTYNMKQKDKAWKEWWKKKRNVSEDLLMAAEMGDLQKVCSLIDKEQQGEFVANIRFQGLDDFTALHFAAQEGRRDVCNVLIENGANLEARSSIGRTPLHLASLRGHTDVARVLIENGADINCQDEESYTPLHYASEMGNSEVAAVLVEKGADVNLRNNLGAKPGDICQNVDVRTIIEKHEENDLSTNDTLSKRSTFGSVILHNDRKSYVQRLMGRFQKMDKYLKETVNGSEEALIQNIEKQQRMREEEKKRERGLRDYKTEGDKNKKNKKAGRFDKNRDRFVRIVQFEKKMREELDSFNTDSDIAGPALFNPIGRLGRGSFGEVYLVEKLPEGDQYAMKILHKRKIMGQNLVRYARTERDVLSYFSHPFIVSIKYAFQTPEKLYMILEYCPGGDLGSVLKREKKLSEERAKLYLAEIVIALEELHKKDIIFRDLKPDNVVLDHEGHAMLTDFGLSKEGVNNNTSAKSF